MAKKLGGGVSAVGGGSGGGVEAVKGRTKEEILALLDEDNADNPVNIVRKQLEARAAQLGTAMPPDDDGYGERRSPGVEEE